MEEEEEKIVIKERNFRGETLEGKGVTLPRNN